MLRPYYLPPGVEPPATRPGLHWLACPWTPEALGRLAAALEAGGEALRAIPTADLLDAWAGTVEAFLDSASAERRGLDGELARLCRLSPQGLAAGLEAVLGGVRRQPAEALLTQAEALRPEAPQAPVLVILASNLPALAVQPLLPALALRRPVLLKSSSVEPLFAPSFLAALAAREPRLAGAVAAVSWPGGDARLEAPVLASVGTVIVYGDAPTLSDLERRAPGKLVGYGPRTSLAILGAVADPRQAAEGIARDIALFDQRGCLSVAAIYVDGDARHFAECLGQALKDKARQWPPGPADAAVLATVQQMRLEAEMRGLPACALAVGDGTVIVDADPAFRLSPGLRTVRVHPLDSLSRLPEILAPWKDRLQGAALAGEDAWRLAEPLAALGVSRCAPPGELQTPDASWHNGGISPLAALGCAAP